MCDKHQPSDEFVEKLEWQIGVEVRRRNRSAQTARSTTLSRTNAAVALAGLVLVSMGIGAAGAAAAYQSRGNERRDLLISSFERRAELARQRFALVSEQLQVAERNVSLGVGDRQSLLDSRLKVAEAQAQIKAIELQMEEIRATGRDPLNELSSPIAGGRDFLSERLQIEMAAQQTALDTERLRLQEVEKRVSLGVADGGDVDVSRTKLAELEAALDAIRGKLSIRAQFLKGGIDGVDAELRVLAGDAEQRLKTFRAKLNLARGRSQAAEQKVQLGTGQRIDVAEAALRQQELQTEVTKAELDLELARRQLEQRRRKR